MYRITTHPIIDIPDDDVVEFQFEGKTIRGQRGKTIAAALHQAGYPVHSHSLKGRPRSLECGIGKCGACEMLVDGQVRRICITNVDGVKTVETINQHCNNAPGQDSHNTPEQDISNTSGLIIDKSELKIGKSGQMTDKSGQMTGKSGQQCAVPMLLSTIVAIIGGGPSGLACREQLRKFGIDNIVIDSNSHVGGQFNMQTHQFFFFEQVQRYGGMRGFDIAKTLAGDDIDGIMLNTTVWDILDGRRLALKNVVTGDVSYLDAQYLVVATGAVPFMPVFENDDVPGVYTAAVFQKMMNQELTLLGKRVLTVGAGNIGYLTSYQAFQAGATIRAIIEGMDHEGGFPVQANRVRRLGIPILTSHVLLKAIPNADGTGITGAVVARCEIFRPIPGTERVIDDIDIINICTGLTPDSQLLTKGREVFGLHTYGCGDAVRIGEGTSAVLRGRQVAYEVAQELGIRFNYDDFLDVSRQYIDSQQRPVRLLDKPQLPTVERQKERPFVQIDCLYGFACNPCTFSCPQHAISKPSTSSVPTVDYDRCIGCMQCVNHCPGLAIFGYDTRQRRVFLPVEYHVDEGAAVILVDNNGQQITTGTVERVMLKPNKTNIARVAVDGNVELTMIKGLLQPAADADCTDHHVSATQAAACTQDKSFVCHCEDIDADTLLKAVGDRKFISVDELKHTTRMGMGPCRGKRCVARARQLLRSHGIELTGDSTPRAPMANLVTLGDVMPRQSVNDEKHPALSAHIGTAHSQETLRTSVLIAGGGMAGSSLFRYFAGEGMKPLLINKARGSSWRCIGGGRPAFSNPDISDIAQHNLELFKAIQAVCNIDFKPTRYINLVHDDATYQALDASRAWSDAYMIERKDFRREISPRWNTADTTYSHALISNDCWQATPGKTIQYLRTVGEGCGGQVYEDCELLSIEREAGHFRATVCLHDGRRCDIIADHFVNSMGYGSERFTDMLGIDTQLYPVKHQAFITRRMPLIGVGGDSLDMIIDRRHYHGFSAVYGQQFMHTGQIIGCASPDCDSAEAWKNLKTNSREFLQVVSEMFCQWIPDLADVGIHATWAGYYIEPRYIVDPEVGLLTGLRGHGFMLSQYLAKLYVDKYMGRTVPSYMADLALSGNGLSENAFK